jgi:AbrB family looped-hinge helix DNA binding protein
VKTIEMADNGRVVIPSAARRALGLAGAAKFDVEVRDDSIVLHPVVTVPAGDAWLYTTETIDAAGRAAADYAAGRVREATVDEIGELPRPRRRRR